MRSSVSEILDEKLNLVVRKCADNMLEDPDEYSSWAISVWFRKHFEIKEEIPEDTKKKMIRTIIKKLSILHVPWRQP